MMFKTFVYVYLKQNEHRDTLCLLESSKKVELRAGQSASTWLKSMP